MRALVIGAAALLAAGLAGSSLAATGQEPAPDRSWSFEGPFGTYDRAEVQRGYQVYKEVCASCHSMSYLSYRNLQDIGFSEAQVKALAEQYEVTDGPNDDGEMFQRPARPSDRFKPAFPNEKAARAANGGAYPVDLSLVAKARPNGPDYLFALMTGYREPPAGVTVAQGMYYNPYFSGHQIAMPPPLNAGGVAYAGETEATVEQMANDVVTFLMWAAEPKLEERKRLGFKVTAFLLVLGGLFFAVKRKVWADVH